MSRERLTMSMKDLNESLHEFKYIGLLEGVEEGEKWLEV